jgi:hypothetical protein
MKTNLHDNQIIIKSEFYVDEVSPPVSKVGTFSLQTYVSVLAALLQMTQKCVKSQTFGFTVQEHGDFKF